MLKFIIIKNDEIIGTVYGSRFEIFGEHEGEQVEIYSKEDELEVCLDFKLIEQDEKGNTYIYID